MSLLYEARPGEGYLLRVIDGQEFMVGRADGFHPFGLLRVSVLKINKSGSVVETTLVQGSGQPDRFSKGWRLKQRDHSTQVDLYRRTRTHPVFLMPQAEAAELIEQLRARDGKPP